MFLQFAPMFGWDLTIALLLTFGVCTIIICITRKPSSRLGVISTFALACTSFACLVTLLYASFIEPKRIVVHNKTLTAQVVEPLTIAVISDIHTYPGKSTAFLTKLSTIVNAQKPDILLLPGDFIFTPGTDFSALNTLKLLQAPLGKYAVLGNHDQGAYRTVFNTQYVRTAEVDSIVQILQDADIQVLRNTVVNIASNPTTIHIAGIDDIWSNTHDLPLVHSQLNTEADIQILLSHNPSIIQTLASRDYALIVSGHTHGGQVRLPFLGPMATLPTTLGQNVDRGLFAIDETTTLAITQGVGESGARTRLLAPPEVLIITVEPPK